MMQPVSAQLVMIFGSRPSAWRKVRGECQFFGGSGGLTSAMISKEVESAVLGAIVQVNPIPQLRVGKPRRRQRAAQFHFVEHDDAPDD